MPLWLLEFLSVLAISKRTQTALICGLLFYFGINLLGDYMVSHIELQGGSSILQDTIIHKIARRYDKVALATLISFWVLAYKCYQKDKKRFWS